MALINPSLFLYGYEVTENNCAIDFKASALGSEIQATLTSGYYSLGSLCEEVKRAMEDADPSNTYTVTADRTLAGGLENRVTIQTAGTYLSVLFFSGTRAGQSAASLLGFASTDRTGALSYTGTATTGTRLLTSLPGYRYIPPELFKKTMGQRNVASSGKKETIVFSVQSFWQVQFKYITQTEAFNDWAPLLSWLTLQRPFEFTPNYLAPSSVYAGTLESLAGDSEGMGFQLNEMLPDLPNTYDTGIMKFKQEPS